MPAAYVPADHVSGPGVRPHAGVRAAANVRSSPVWASRMSQAACCAAVLLLRGGDVCVQHSAQMRGLRAGPVLPTYGGLRPAPLCAAYALSAPNVLPADGMCSSNVCASWVRIWADAGHDGGCRSVSTVQERAHGQDWVQFHRRPGRICRRSVRELLVNSWRIERLCLRGPLVKAPFPVCVSSVIPTALCERSDLLPDSLSSSSPHPHQSCPGGGGEQAFSMQKAPLPWWPRG